MLIEMAFSGHWLIASYQSAVAIVTRRSTCSLSMSDRASAKVSLIVAAVEMRIYFSHRKNAKRLVYLQLHQLMK